MSSSTRNIHVRCGPVYDNIVPLTSVYDTSVESKGFWTLWSLVGSNLRRQDFACEADGWLAHEACKAHPNVLRDPFGRQLAAHSWVSCGLRVVPTSNNVNRGRSMTPPARKIQQLQRCRSAGPLIYTAQTPPPCMGR